MSGRRRGSHAGEVRAPSAANKYAVRGAEAIVWRAWGLELLRQRDHLEFALRAADEDCETAGNALAEAQRDGDPRKITAAHSALEDALKTAQQSFEACDRVRRRLRAELDLLARASKRRAVADLISQIQRERSAIIAQVLDAPVGAARPARGVAVPPAPRLPVLRWLRRLTAPRRRGEAVVAVVTTAPDTAS